MSDHNSSNSESNLEPTEVTYSDFYELLGVGRDDDTEVIEQRGRKLLARYHPDTSDQANSKEIYKTLNRAQVVLTDPDQREIYDRLGHKEYVTRREKDGTVSQSETVSHGDFTPADDDVSEEDNSSGSTHASTARNSRNTQVSDNPSNSGGYESLTDIKTETNSDMSVWRIFRQMWFLRIVIGGAALGAGVHAGAVTNSPVPTFFIEGIVPSVVGNLAIVVGGIIGLGVLLTGGLSYGVLKRVEDEIDVEPTVEKAQEQRKQDSSRGYNINTTPETDTSQTSEWDVTTQRDSTQAQKANSEADRTNSALRYGTRLLVVGAVIIGVGTVPTAVSPLEYLYLILLNGGADVPLWLDLGLSDAVVQMLLNIGLSLLGALTCVGGLVGTLIGLSKEVWHRHYFTKGNYLPFLWEGLVSVVFGVAIIGAVFGQESVGELPMTRLPEMAQAVLGGTGGGVGLTLFILSVGATLCISMILKIRVTLGSQVG